jgi:Golgi nucleoside diphosphatase
VDLTDLTALITKLVMDPEFKKVLEAGVDGLDKVPAELGDLDFSEVIELASLVPDILKVIKG